MCNLLNRLVQVCDRRWFSPISLPRLAICRIRVHSISFEKIGGWIRSKFAAPRGLTKFAVLFDGQCPLCIRSVTTVDFLDWRGKFVFRDVNDWEQISRDYPGLDQQKSLEEMQVMIPRQGGYKALAGFFAFRKIAQHLPLGMLIWPFLYIPGVPFIGTRFYHFVASRRKRITGGARCSFHTCKIPVTSDQDSAIRRTDWSK